MSVSLFIFLDPVIHFFFNNTATTEIYTLSLHDALPISTRSQSGSRFALRIHACRSVVPGGKVTGRCPESQRKDRKSTRLNSSHTVNSYAVFCLKKKTHFDGRKGQRPRFFHEGL